MRKRNALLDSALAEPIRRFVAQKRALNRQFHNEERTLSMLDRYLVEQGVLDLLDVTPHVVEAFLSSRPRTRPGSYNKLLAIVRGLFDWMVAQQMLDVSPVQVRPRRDTARRVPYLFDLPSASRLIEIAAALPDSRRATLRGPTYATIFALLFGLGLRCGEAARLTRADVDLGRQLLVIRGAKFGKSRLVPFGPSMGARLAGYIQLRERKAGKLTAEAPIFSFTSGRRIHPAVISNVFHQLVSGLGLAIASGVRPPCAHHLRHSFAVTTLLRWYREGTDPAARLLHLSTFLGHVNPASTAVYLTITGDLLQAAGERFERFAAPLSKDAVS
jgi:site-specific recombinase XerD